MQKFHFGGPNLRLWEDNRQESDAIINPRSSNSAFTVPAGGASEVTGLPSWESGGGGGAVN